jgi:hypothetical protein
MTDTLTIDQIAERMHVTPSLARRQKLDEVDVLIFGWKARTGCKLNALQHCELVKAIRAMKKRIENRA